MAVLTGCTWTPPENNGEQGNYGPLPDGWYDAVIERTERKQTKSGDGFYLNVMYRITGPTHGNRVVFDIMNIWNTRPETVRIACQQLTTICTCVGMNKFPKDTDELVGKNIQIKLTTKQSEGYEPKNQIKAWRKSDTPNASPPVKQASTPAWAQDDYDDDIAF